MEENMYGIIDIGSNTMRLSCFNVENKTLKSIFHKKIMAGLAGYVEEGKLSEKGIDKAVDTLLEFKQIIQNISIEKLFIIATASFRNVNNTDIILKVIKEKTGFLVEVLSGEEEAKCDFVGATYCLNAKSGVVVDIGGGSTEMVTFDSDSIEKAVSVPIGSLNMFTMFVDKIFPKNSESMKIRNAVKNELNKVNRCEKQTVLGVGGTNRAVCKLYNDYYEKDKNNLIMNCNNITEMLDDMLENKDKATKKILRIVPDRIHTIMPGMFIMDEINNYYKCETIEVSEWGVREGYLLNKLVINRG